MATQTIGIHRDDGPCGCEFCLMIRARASAIRSAREAWKSHELHCWVCQQKQGCCQRGQPLFRAWMRMEGGFQ